MIQQSHFWVFAQNSWNQDLQEISALPCSHSTIHNSQHMETTKMPMTDEGVRKMWYAHTREYYSALKKKEILPYVTTWMNLEDIMLSEIN